MDLKNIKLLAKILNESALTAVEVSEGENKIRLERNVAVQGVPSTSVVLQAADTIPAVPPPAEDASIDFNKLQEIKSPMVGIFYAAASPKDKPFVEVGKRIKKGDVVCIIEAMKVMNEILAECDGEIVDICAQNGHVVEFSQVLFKVF